MQIVSPLSSLENSRMREIQNWIRLFHHSSFRYIHSKLIFWYLWLWRFSESWICYFWSMIDFSWLWLYYRRYGLDLIWYQEVIIFLYLTRFNRVVHWAKHVNFCSITLMKIFLIQIDYEWLRKFQCTQINFTGNFHKGWNIIIHSNWVIKLFEPWILYDLNIYDIKFSVGSYNYWMIMFIIECFKVYWFEF